MSEILIKITWDSAENYVKFSNKLNEIRLKTEWNVHKNWVKFFHHLVKFSKKLTETRNSLIIWMKFIETYFSKNCVKLFWKLREILLNVEWNSLEKCMTFSWNCGQFSCKLYEIFLTFEILLKSKWNFSNWVNLF